MSSYYKPGGWNTICQVCGRQFKNDQVRKRWDGLIVCHNDYEERHIADFLRVRTEHSTPPYVSPDPDDVFLPACDMINSSAMADYAVADCARTGVTLTTKQLHLLD